MDSEMNASGPQMNEEQKRFHRTLAVDLFNYVWTLLDKGQRSIEEDDEMIHAAHASRFHWGRAGTAVNLARGEWQISRVYAMLRRPESAFQHARRCLDICLANSIGDFDLAFAYEALARAAALGGRTAERATFINLAERAAAGIQEEEDRKLLLSDLASIPLVPHVADDVAKQSFGSFLR